MKQMANKIKSEVSLNDEYITRKKYMGKSCALQSHELVSKRID